MRSLMLFFLCTVSAQEISPIYRVYLRGLKQAENQRKQAALINEAITYIEDHVFTAAKQGFVNYTTESFEGCEVYSKRMALDRGVCENVVTEVRNLVSERFPDSEVIYDKNTHKYTLKWD